jgi:hypothetical protein
MKSTSAAAALSRLESVAVSPAAAVASLSSSRPWKQNNNEDPVAGESRGRRKTGVEAAEADVVDKAAAAAAAAS